MSVAVKWQEEAEEVRAGTRILGPDGPIAALLPGYEPRQPQIEMADLCDQVIEDGGQALIEAGTGTGKSLAYLIPAVLSGKKVLVSTDTIQLQEQLVGKDLPFLEKALGQKIHFAIAKGRGNYFCRRNAESLVQENALIDPLGVAAAGEMLQSFRSGAWDGDKATLKLQVDDLRWSDVSGEDSCTGTQCPYAFGCPYLDAKEKVAEADVVITNHTMYLLHHYVQERSGGVMAILPEHATWIADEAHTLGDKALDVWGVELPQSRPGSFVRKVLKQARRLDLELEDVNLERINQRAAEFFGTFYGAMKEQQLLEDFPEEILELAQDRSEALIRELKPVRVALHHATARAELDDRETLRAIQRLKFNSDSLISDLRSIFTPASTTCRACEGTGQELEQEGVFCVTCSGTGALPDPEPPVLYCELSEGRQGMRFATLHRKPAETRRIFQKIHGNLQAGIFCSATLAIGQGPGAFGPVAGELGLNLACTETLRVASPFDYPRQVIGYVPSTVPEAKSPLYQTALAAEIVRILDYTQGRAFILFTSTRDMKAVYELVAVQVRFPMLLQGTKPKDLLIEEFKATPHSVLFGVKTFWTGVDITGDALSCVVIVKLPFPQFDHPLTKARCARIEKRGGNSFGEFMLPRCIRDVCQGFGRLIRSKRDEGIFVILDPRMHTARYGRQIASALPPFPCVDRL